MTESPPPLLLWLPGEENTIREEDEVDARSTRQPADASFLVGGKAGGGCLVMGNDRLVLCSRLSEGGISKMVAVQLLLTKGSDLVDESLSWLTRDCPAD